MNAPRYRFGSHAHILRANRWLPIVWVRGKIPGTGWSQYSLVYPTDAQIEAWRFDYADCGIGLVMDGRFVAVDIDVCPDRFRAFGFSAKDAAREAPALVDKIKGIAIEALGPIDFARVGLPPKVMLLYWAADAVPTMAGGPVEVFSAAGSKQVVIGGFHPEAVDEYRWVGRCNPVTHSIDTLHPVTAKQVVDFRARALELCEEAGLKPQMRATIGHNSGCVSSGIVGLHERCSVADRQGVALRSARYRSPVFPPVGRW
jgi:hypothetical protein